MDVNDVIMLEGYYCLVRYHVCIARNVILPVLLFWLLTILTAILSASVL